MFRRSTKPGWDNGLFRFGFSNPVVSSGRAEANVVVTLVGVVLVTASATDVTRLVVPGTPAHNTLGTGFSTAIREIESTGHSATLQAGAVLVVQDAKPQHQHDTSSRIPPRSSAAKSVRR